MSGESVDQSLFAADKLFGTQVSDVTGGRGSYEMLTPEQLHTHNILRLEQDEQIRRNGLNLMLACELQPETIDEAAQLNRVNEISSLKDFYVSNPPEAFNDQFRYFY